MQTELCLVVKCLIDKFGYLSLFLFPLGQTLKIRIAADCVVRIGIKVLIFLGDVAQDYSDVFSLKKPFVVEVIPKLLMQQARTFRKSFSFFPKGCYEKLAENL